MLVVNGIDTVILHMPKCAGSSVRWAIVKKYDYRWSCEHADIKSLPEQYKDFKRVGFCRNPISWYASKYYYGASSKKIPLSLILILSDEYNLSFKQALPRLLDMKNFFDMHKSYLVKFQKRLQQLAMGRYLCWITQSYTDLLNLPEFGNTLYDHWYKMVGLDTATVYKMDDNKFFSNLVKEFPGIKLTHRNAGTKLNLMEEYDKCMLDSVALADSNYFKKHNYEVVYA